MDFSHLVVEFFTDTKLNKSKSTEAGRSIYEEIEKVKIRAAGDPKTVFVAPAHSQSAVRDPATNRPLTYAQLHKGPYDAFKDGKDYIGSGTPISELPFINKAKARELKDLNIKTAEALAALDGSNLQRLGMGARELKNQAQAWLDSASGSAEFTKLAAENTALQERITALEAMMQNQPAPSAEPVKETSSPFDDWDDDTIKLWIIEQGGGGAATPRLQACPTG